MKYQRTSGYRNWMNQRLYYPQCADQFARLQCSGDKYVITAAGWRKLPDGI
jgi:hypothetical protein